MDSGQDWRKGKQSEMGYGSGNGDQCRSDNYLEENTTKVSHLIEYG